MSFALWVLLCGFCSVGFALWVLLCGFCSVGFALWVLLCGFCSVGFSFLRSMSAEYANEAFFHETSIIRIFFCNAKLVYIII
jgi:hypothetical protein